MLEVSEKLKKAFMTDNVEKHIRITFPNGEHEDITNNKIEANSFSFTESLCSQDELKYGLCEANVIKVSAQCENIKGCIIKVFIDAFYEGEVFTVPLGVFSVESCQVRAGTSLREIEAYEITGVTSKISKIEQFRRSIPTLTATTDIVPISNFLYTSLPYVENSEEITENSSVIAWYYEKDNVRYEVGVYYYYINVDCANDTAIYSIKGEKKEDYNEKISHLKLIMSYDIWRPDLHGYQDSTPLPYIKYCTIYKPGTVGTSADERIINLDFNERAYLHINGYVSTYSGKDIVQNMAIRVPYRFVINTDNTREEIELYENNNIKFYKHNPNNAQYFDFNIELKRNIALPTPTPANGTVRQGTAYYIDDKDINKYSLQEIGNSYFELNGIFGKINKNGDFVSLNINNSFALYPEDVIFPNNELYPVNPSNYQPLEATAYKAAYYEEYVTHKIGYVRVTYLATDNEKYSITVKCDPNYDNVYNMTNNYVFLNKVWTAKQVKEMILTYFYPNINEVSYSPAQVSIKGLPFVEAGDVIKVHADNGIFKTFVFRRTLTGEQVLVDNIEAKGNERNVNADAWLINVDIEERS